jgi:hypothetical protein
MRCGAVRQLQEFGHNSIASVQNKRRRRHVDLTQWRWGFWGFTIPAA